MRLNKDTLRVGMKVHFPKLGRTLRIDGFARPVALPGEAIHWNKRGTAYTLSNKAEADHVHLMDKSGFLISMDDLLRAGRVP